MEIRNGMLVSPLPVYHIAETVDPAAQTEMMLIRKETGFNVTENPAGNPAPLHITGEGFSEFATRIGDLVCVRGRWK